MSTFKQISVQEVHEMIATQAVSIVDIRDANSYLQGHIPEAQVVNDENIQKFLQEVDHEKPLICYCYHGISSQRAALFFSNQGFKKVYSMDGGWEAWKAAYG